MPCDAIASRCCARCSWLAASSSRKSRPAGSTTLLSAMGSWGCHTGACKHPTVKLLQEAQACSQATCLSDPHLSCLRSCTCTELPSGKPAQQAQVPAVNGVPGAQNQRQSPTSEHKYLGVALLVKILHLWATQSMRQAEGVPQAAGRGSPAACTACSAGPVERPAGA